MKSPKLLLLLLLALLIPLLAGCGSAPPLPPEKQPQVLSALVDLDKLDLNGLIAQDKTLSNGLDRLGPPTKQTTNDIGFLLLQKGYVIERVALLKNLDRGQFNEALTLYKNPTLRGSVYGSVASMRTAQVAGLLWGQKNTSNPEQAKGYQQDASKALEQFSYAPLTTWALVRARPEVPGWPQPLAADQRGTPPAAAPSLSATPPLRETADWPFVPARKQANAWIDPLLPQQLAISALQLPRWHLCLGRLQRQVRPRHLPHRRPRQARHHALLGGAVPQHAGHAALPAGTEEAAGEVQGRQAGDGQGADGVDEGAQGQPGQLLLPMILQMVILIQVYWGIRHYIWNFQNVHFLYLTSLANPDTLMIHGTPFPGPILILYAASMYFTQKLISMPAATPEQQQQQRMMSVMMPFLMLMIMQSLPAAFILYWFLQNVLMTGHQWLIMRPHRAADAAAAAAAQAAGGPPGPKDQTQAPAPPEALDRLSQESKPPKKKKKRRYWLGYRV